MNKKIWLSLLSLISSVALGACSFLEPSDSSQTSTSSPTSEVKNTFTVKWVNDNGDILELDENLEEGVIPTYDGVTPKKEKDSQYTYSWNGWTPQISPLSRDTTYRATYSKELNTYKVSFYNDDKETLLYEEECQYGTMPKYKGPIPKKDFTTEISYIFDGWDREFESVNGDTSYYAKYKNVTNQYKVSWFDMDGETLLHSKLYNYGEMPSYTWENPSKETTFKFSYEFLGWDKQASIVTGNQSYIAQFKVTQLNYEINFDANGGTGTDFESSKFVKAFDATMFPVYMQKENYKFRGWAEKSTHLKVVDEYLNIVNPIELKDNMTFEAIFEKNIRVCVCKGDDDDPVYGSQGIVEEIDTYFDYPSEGSSNVVVLSAKANPGFKFDGWYTFDFATLSFDHLLVDIYGDRAPEKFNYTVGNDDILIGAKFTKDTFEVNCFSNATEIGKVIDCTITDSYSDEFTHGFLFGSTVKVNTAPLSDNEIFYGWYLNGVLVAQTLEYEFVMPAKNVELEARWSMELFELRCFSSETEAALVKNRSNDDSSVGEFALSCYAGTRVKVTTTSVLKNGTNFYGWFLNGERVSTSYNYEFRMPASKCSLEARWEIVKRTLNVFTSSDAEVKDLLSDEPFKLYFLHDYMPGSTIKITTRSKEEGTNWFEGWYSNGVLVSTDLTYEFVLTDDAHTDYSANWNTNKCELTIQTNGEIAEVKDITGESEYSATYIKAYFPRTKVKVTTQAKEADKYVFDGWYLNGERISQEIEYEFEVPNAETFALEARWANK